MRLPASPGRGPGPPWRGLGVRRRRSWPLPLRGGRRFGRNAARGGTGEVDAGGPTLNNRQWVRKRPVGSLPCRFRARDAGCVGDCGSRGRGPRPSADPGRWGEEGGGSGSPPGSGMPLSSGRPGVGQGGPQPPQEPRRARGEGQKRTRRGTSPGDAFRSPAAPRGEFVLARAPRNLPWASLAAWSRGPGREIEGYTNGGDGEPRAGDGPHRHGGECPDGGSRPPLNDPFGCPGCGRRAGEPGHGSPLPVGTADREKRARVLHRRAGRGAGDRASNSVPPGSPFWGTGPAGRDSRARSGHLPRRGR